jgi:hypothetical protein
MATRPGLPKPIGEMAEATGGQRPRPRARDASPEKADPFDLWLRHSLRQAFGSIAAEPVPEELLRLMEEGPCERDDGTSSS